MCVAYKPLMVGGNYLDYIYIYILTDVYVYSEHKRSLTYKLKC